MRDEALDAIVDEVARALTATPAPAALAPAVRARIASGAEHRRSRWVPMATAAAIACVVVVLLAGSRLFVPSPPVAPPSPIATADIALRPPAADVAAGNVGPVPRRGPGVVTTARERQPMVDADRDTAPALPPLRLVPLELEPLPPPQTRAAVADPPMPLEIAPLRIEPLASN